MFVLQIACGFFMLVCVSSWETEDCGDEYDVFYDANDFSCQEISSNNENVEKQFGASNANEFQASYIAEKLSDLHKGCEKISTEMSSPIDPPIYQGAKVTVSEAAFAFLSLIEFFFFFFTTSLCFFAESVKSSQVKSSRRKIRFTLGTCLCRTRVKNCTRCAPYVIKPFNVK